MEGTVEVESEVGEGSLFTVTIPFIVKPEDDSSEESGKEQEKTHITQILCTVQERYLSMMTNFEETPQELTMNKQIVVAEDNPINRKVILCMINSLGYEADVVVDGLELVEKFAIGYHKVVITDMVCNMFISINISSRTCQI